MAGLFKEVVNLVARGAHLELLADPFLLGMLENEPCPVCFTSQTMRLVEGAVWRPDGYVKIRAFVCSHCTAHVMPDLPGELRQEAA